MLPSIEQAEKELRYAGEINPGPWVDHSFNVGIAAREIAKKVPGLDPEKAYIVGILHDIGRRVGIVDIPTHVYEGYKFAMENGWDEVAKVCMTHSYPLMEKELDYESSNESDEQIKEFIHHAKCDDYDLLIQLCDSLAADYGFCILEKRFVDVTRRHGVFKYMIERWNVTIDIKDYFEHKISGSIYDLLPDIKETTLLTPKPWTPPASK